MPKSFFLKNNKVSKERVQLVGVTSMQIASKYEEIYSPEVEDFVYITDKAYCRNSKILQEKQLQDIVKNGRRRGKLEKEPLKLESLEFHYLPFFISSAVPDY